MWNNVGICRKTYLYYWEISSSGSSKLQVAGFENVINLQIRKNVIVSKSFFLQLKYFIIIIQSSICALVFLIFPCAGVVSSSEPLYKTFCRVLFLVFSSEFCRVVYNNVPQFLKCSLCHLLLASCVLKFTDVFSSVTSFHLKAFKLLFSFTTLDSCYIFLPRFWNFSKYFRFAFLELRNLYCLYL